MRTWQETEPVRRTSPYSLVAPRRADARARVEELGALLRSGLYLTTWALLGVLFWTPRLLGALLLSSFEAICSAVTRTRPHDRHLRRAAELYESLVRSMEPARTSPYLRLRARGDRPRRPAVALLEAGWTVVVWYAILWSAGVIEVTPFELMASLT